MQDVIPKEGINSELISDLGIIIHPEVQKKLWAQTGLFILSATNTLEKEASQFNLDIVFNTQPAKRITRLRICFSRFFYFIGNFSFGEILEFCCFCIFRKRLYNRIAGAYLVREEFGIQDPDILMAIAFHSVRVGMKPGINMLCSYWIGSNDNGGLREFLYRMMKTSVMIHIALTAISLYALCMPVNAVNGIYRAYDLCTDRRKAAYILTLLNFFIMPVAAMLIIVRFCNPRQIRAAYVIGQGLVALSVTGKMLSGRNALKD